MFKLTVAAFLATAVAGVAGLVLNTPTSLVACEPALLSFSGAEGAVEIQVFKGGLTGDPSETPLEVLPVVPEGENQTTWVVDTPAGAYLSSLRTRMHEHTHRLQAKTLCSWLSTSRPASLPSPPTCPSPPELERARFSYLVLAGETVRRTFRI
ncbi:hypothetical protein EXIGLDRAFT_829365 [Exidia glandulosa HHB12029]|uniref:Uncharacterized protein n=1 Tax=Exidia glandulosa HHB12029 TaxID=1314781 RepID=A0A165PPT2_EXIGL|nr:hypothetical protein EXIGLDRAFT_829365 [Exidia glandulosa HHB12029]